MVYRAAMRRDRHLRTSHLVRVAVLVGASVVIGTAAHVSAAQQHLPRLGPVLVSATLVALAVSGIAGAGAWLDGRVARHRRDAAVPDLSAGAALVAGQAIVHWSIHPAATVASRAGGHQSHHADPHGPASTLDLPVLGGHTGGIGMLLAHSIATLCVGLLLRWLERSVLGLAHVLATTGTAVHAALSAGALLTAPRLPATTPRGTWVGPQPTRGRPAALHVLRAAVVRRGPPGVGAPA